MVGTWLGWKFNPIDKCRPIPAISIDHGVSGPFDSKWLSWIGPWTFTLRRENGKERAVSNPYLWGLRGSEANILVLRLVFSRYSWEEKVAPTDLAHGWMPS